MTGNADQARALAELAKTLKTTAEGKDTLRRLRKELRKEAEPMRKSVQRAALGLPSDGENARRGRPSLRRTLSRASRVKVSFSRRTAGVMVVTGPGGMPEGTKGLPPYIEGEGPWRHPVWGRDQWVRQQAMPFFYPAIRPHEASAPAAGERVLDQLIKEIESS
ncbi:MULTISPECIES: hypothetical protein [unclassified Nonomuraea]|uniref:hypothetical protein n=1 Tax=unclassified Nonomuraea TaxID=2593643 RepID=UPI0033E8578F